MTAPPVALVGSRHPLTSAVASALRAQGRRSVLCELIERPEPDTPPADVLTFRIEHLGTLLARLRDLGVGEVCLVGAVGRPRIDPSRIDAATAPLAPRLEAALRQGDDGALRAVLAVFEEAGFRVRGAHELAPQLLPPAGVLSALRPTAGHVADAGRAAAVHRVMAAADVGQGVVVRDGQVLAVEASPGTDWMLRSVAGLADGAMFFKGPKRGQDRRVDLPTIGLATVEHARAARLGAVVIEAGGVIVLGREAVAQAADAAGIVLWVREPGP